MPVKYDVVATVGSYIANGQTKYNTRKVGVILETSKGFALKLDGIFSPAGMKMDDSGSVWLNLYPPKEYQRAQSQGIRDQVNQPNSPQQPPPPPQHTNHQNPPQNPHQAYGGQPAPAGGQYDDDIPFAQYDWRLV